MPTIDPRKPRCGIAMLRQDGAMRFRRHVEMGEEIIEPRLGWLEGSGMMKMFSWVCSHGDAFWFVVVFVWVPVLFVCFFVCLFACLFVCLSVCLFVCLFVGLLVCLFVCWFVGLSVFRGSWCGLGTWRPSIRLTSVYLVFGLPLFFMYQQH